MRWSGLFNADVRHGRDMQMHGLSRKLALIFIPLLLSACAHAVNTLDHVRIGMDRELAINSASGSPTPYYLKGETTEYVLFRVMTNLYSMYGEYPNDVLFIRLENGKVVDKGVADASEERNIRKISPSFVLREWQRKGALSPAQAHER